MKKSDQMGDFINLDTKFMFYMLFISHIIAWDSHSLTHSFTI